MTTDYEIRPLRKEDVDKLLYGSDVERPWIQNLHEYMLEHGSLGFVAVISSQIVGYALSSKYSSVVLLDHLFVSPQYRGQGIGKTLTQHTLERRKQDGSDAVKVNVDPNNEPALNLFKQYGFEFTPIDQRYLGTLRL